jgi:hypothetical protein
MSQGNYLDYGATIEGIKIRSQATDSFLHKEGFNSERV